MTDQEIKNRLKEINKELETLNRSRRDGDDSDTLEDIDSSISELTQEFQHLSSQRTDIEL